jgi:phosphohistidine phosphatase SixA
MWRSIPRLLCLLAGAAALGVAVASSVGHLPPDTLDDAALAQALREGGLVLYLRHGQTDRAARDTDRSDLSRCERQRGLSDAGRAELRQVGAAVQALGLRVDSVRASPYCRTLETARLAFGRAEPEPLLKLTIAEDAATARARSAALAGALSLPPPPGTLNVLVGHSGNLLDASGLWPEPEGVALVFRPLGDGRFDYVAHIPPQRWPVLARQAAR